MARAMRAERERACDDQVLAAGTKASDYAHELLDIVSGLREPELAAALAMARRFTTGRPRTGGVKSGIASWLGFPQKRAGSGQ